MKPTLDRDNTCCVIAVNLLTPHLRIYAFTHLMKLYMEPITMDTTEQGRPKCIHWRGTSFEVRELEDYWIFCGKWWQTEEKRYYLRVQTRQGSMEIFRRNGSWVLSRILD